MSTFGRTLSGKASKYLFHPDEPIIFVEGPTDLTAYTRLAELVRARVEEAGGRAECEKLVLEMVRDDLPFVILMDGDYRVLARQRSQHRRVIHLRRYSVENYLFEREALSCVIRGYARLGGPDASLDAEIDSLFSEAETSLRELIQLDVAARVVEDDDSILPPSIERLLQRTARTAFDIGRIHGICSAAAAKLPTTSVSRARTLIAAFPGRLLDLLDGHLAFGLMRRFIIDAVTQRRRRKPNIDNDGLLLMLGNEVWFRCPHADHRSLRRRLSRACGEVRRMLKAA